MSDLKMPDINNVLIAGSLLSDPVFKKTSNGLSLVCFQLSSSRRYRDNSGIWRENICNVGVVAWQRLAEACKETLLRGSAVLIEGELQSKNMQNNEETASKSLVEIRARRIQFLDRKPSFEVEETSEGQFISRSDEPVEKKYADNQKTKMQQVALTDFDFGYQNLEL